MSNALTHIPAVKDDSDLQKAVGYMDHYTDQLKWLNNATKRCAGYGAKAGFVTKPEDSLVGVGEAVQDTILPFKRAFMQAYLQYWGAQQDPPKTLDPNKFKDNITGWALVQDLVCAAESECAGIIGRQICLTDSGAAHGKQWFWLLYNWNTGQWVIPLLCGGTTTD
jgi:hypothetical protein